MFRVDVVDGGSLTFFEKLSQGAYRRAYGVIAERFRARGLGKDEGQQPIAAGDS